MSNVIFVSCDGDDVMKAIHDAAMRNQAEEISRISHMLERGNAVLTSWALRRGGSTIEGTAGDDVFLTVPADALEELEDIRDQYAELVGKTVSVGVGPTLEASYLALQAAKKQGKDQVVVAGEEQPDEPEPVAKSEIPAAPAPVLPPQDAMNPANGAPDMAPVQSIQDKIRDLAQRCLTAEQGKLADDGTAAAAIRERLADILAGMRDRREELQMLVQNAPGVAEVLMDLIATVRDMARTLPQEASSEVSPEVYSEPQTEAAEPMQKAAGQGGGIKGRVHITQPVNTVQDGKIKVFDPKTGGTKWRGVLDGMIMDKYGNPISPKKPGKYAQ